MSIDENAFEFAVKQQLCFGKWREDFRDFVERYERAKSNHQPVELSRDELSERAPAKRIDEILTQPYVVLKSGRINYEVRRDFLQLATELKHLRLDLAECQRQANEMIEARNRTIGFLEAEIQQLRASKREISEEDSQVIGSHDPGRQEGVRPPALRQSSSLILCQKEVEKVMDGFIREWSVSNLYDAVSTFMKRYKITHIEDESETRQGDQK